MKAMKDYKYHSGITMHAYFSSAQKKNVEKNDNAMRYTYNKCVEIDKELYLLNKTKCPISVIKERIEFLNTLKGSATEISNMAPFLNEKGVDSLAKANAIKNYNTAWKNYRENKNTGIPTFHKKGYEKSYQTNAQYDSKKVLHPDLFSGSVCFLDRNHVQLPILGRVRIKTSDKLISALFENPDARIGTVTIGIDSCGDGYISMQLASDIPFHKMLPKTDSLIGIDVNLDNFYATSEGDIIENPRYAKSSKDKLAKEQWKLSRKKNAAEREGRDFYLSKRYQEQRLKVAKISRHIKNQRKDFQHNQSKDLIESQDYIFAEDINSKNLQKNHKLAYAIADVSWSSFLSMLEYKAGIYDKTFLKVNPRNTTQTCSCCGYLNEGENILTLTDRDWVCPQCGEQHIRDINAAINILQRGMQTLNLL